jgi:hypothetical protein
MQAGEHGVPQSRQRVIIWGSLSDHPLPEFPNPSHEFFGQTAGKDAPHKAHTALYPALTAGDALSDLPPFDWVNPRQVVPESVKQKEERLKRSITIPAYKVMRDQPYVGLSRQEYASPPINEYQRRLRSNCQLTNHVTTSYFDKDGQRTKTGAICCAMTEQICSVGLQPGSDYRSMPEALRPGRFKKKDIDGSIKLSTRGYSNYKRVNPDTHFGICLATPAPCMRGGPVSGYTRLYTSVLRLTRLSSSIQINIERSLSVNMLEPRDFRIHLVGKLRRRPMSASHSE